MKLTLTHLDLTSAKVGDSVWSFTSEHGKKAADRPVHLGTITQFEVKGDVVWVHTSCGDKHPLDKETDKPVSQFWFRNTLLVHLLVACKTR